MAAGQLSFPLFVLLLQVFERALVRSHDIGTGGDLEPYREIDIDIAEVVSEGEELRAGEIDATGGGVSEREEHLVGGRVVDEFVRLVDFQDPTERRDLASPTRGLLSIRLGALVDPACGQSGT